MSPPEPPEPPPRRGALIAILLLLVLSAAGWWIANRLHQTSVLQDCVMQGRRNCAPVGN